jgi:hypothetical protein
MDGRGGKNHKVSTTREDVLGGYRYKQAYAKVRPAGVASTRMRMT